MLKLKTSRFALRTRAARLSSPTVLPDRLFDLARSLLAKEATGIAFRLIGIGANLLVPGSNADQGDLGRRDHRPHAPPRRRRSMLCAGDLVKPRSRAGDRCAD